MLDKRILRAKILKERKSLSQEIIRKASDNIQKELTCLPEFMEARNIFSYSSLPREIDTQYIWKYKDTKNLIFPKVDQGVLRLFMVESKEDLKPGVKGILEPFRGQEISPETPDFIIVPGVAFDKKGNRLGYGGGYYDKLLPSVLGLKVGVVLERYCFPENTLTLETHDIPVDVVVSEAGVFWR
ncbi:MAG: 5-formyltetrahydrofolate cyclo-ligase [Firmicutes bacterium]|nr:5-formyltetrahydrofolate cyclo-ligase [Bacillota bacterium]MDD4693857.1 5-formyltetrahydrofolate cyclo-ligase [Bacillota bacterium]